MTNQVTGNTGLSPFRDGVPGIGWLGIALSENYRLSSNSDSQYEAK